MVKVTQADIDRAAKAYDAIAGCTVPLSFGDRVRAGEKSELAALFAAHADAARREGVKLALEAAASVLKPAHSEIGMDDWDAGVSCGVRDMAEAIRALTYEEIVKGVDDAQDA